MDSRKCDGLGHTVTCVTEDKSIIEGRAITNIPHQRSTIFRHGLPSSFLRFHERAFDPRSTVESKQTRLIIASGTHSGHQGLWHTLTVPQLYFSIE